MKEIFVADSETDPFKFGRVPEPFIWGLYHPNYPYMDFYSTSDFINYVADKNIIVYGHNAGKFDWHFLADYMEPATEILIINNRLSKFKIGKCEFRDSYNLMPVSLAQYQKDDIDYWKFEAEHRDYYMDEIRSYLRSDCVYLHQLVSRFIDDYGFNRVPITLASAAMNYWRMQHNSGKSIENSGEGFYKTFAPYYYGGRVECFQKGLIGGPIEAWDINSAYPYAMTHKHPYGCDYEVSSQGLAPKNVENQDFVTVTARSLGAFPYREKSGLSFPADGQWRQFHVTGWEFNAALELGLCDGVIIERLYRFFDRIEFTDYVDHFYTLKARCKGKDKAGYLMAKLFLNSLYGKMAANPDNYKHFELLPPQYIEASQRLEGKRYAGNLGKHALMSYELHEEEKRFYNVATGASITGFVRAYLLRNLHKCDGLIYCDTDCIIARETNLASGSDLGLWSCEGKFQRGAVAGKKLYAFEDTHGNFKTASKGVRLTPEQIFGVASGREVIYNFDVPTFSPTNGVYFNSRTVKMT